MTRNISVGIVGAGITGLCLKHYLEKRGVEARVYEADSEPGGVIKSKKIDGKLVELGPQRTRLTPSIRGLVNEMGIEESLVTADKTDINIYHSGRLRKVPLTFRDAINTDLLTLREKLRILLEPAFSLLERDKNSETVEEFLSRRFGEGAYENFLGVLYGGIYASNPGDMYMRHSLGKMLERHGIDGSILTSVARKTVKKEIRSLKKDSGKQMPACSFEEGLQELPKAIYERYHEDIHLENPVRGLTDDRELIDWYGDEESFDEVVFTTPAEITANLIEGIDKKTGDRLRRINYNPVAYVHVLSNADFEGFGYQIQWNEDFYTLGVTSNSNLFSTPNREGLFTCFLGGSHNPGVIEWSDEKIKDVATTEFHEITGERCHALNVYRARIPAYDQSWGNIDQLKTPPNIHICTNYTGRAGIPGRVREAKKAAQDICEKVSTNEYGDSPQDETGKDRKEGSIRMKSRR